jgi:hypothetical protein
MPFGEALSSLDLEAGQLVAVSEDLLRRQGSLAARSQIFLTGRKTNGR